MGVPTITQAVRIFEHGAEDVLRFGEYPLDNPGPKDVVVRVEAASVSRWDVKYRVGLPASAHLPGRRFFPLPQQLGREAAGEVIHVGKDVTRLVVGERVVGVVHPEDPLSLEAARGLGNLSPNVEYPGHQSLGAYAQYLVRDESMWLPLKPTVDLEQAAVTLWAYSTSHRVLRDRLGVQLGDVVLVLGASGGMGAATVRLASMLGATVIALTRHGSKEAGLRDIGAHEVVVIDRPEDATEAVQAITSGAGVEHVVDYVGDQALMKVAVANVRLGGKYCVSTGEMNRDPIPVTASDFLRSELSIVGIRAARRHDALVALNLLNNGRISTPIAARFALSEAADAHRFLDANGDAVGRVVLVP